MNFPESPELSNSDHDFLVDCAKDTQKRLGEAVAVTIKGDGEIVDILLKGDGPYIRIVCDEPDDRRPEDKPFSVYTFASKDEFNAKGSDAVAAEPQHASSTNEFTMLQGQTPVDAPLKFMTKEEVAQMLVKLVTKIEHHNRFFE